MRKHNAIRAAAVLVLSCIAVSGAFAGARRVKTEVMETRDITGMFTVILYGGGYLDDLETIAFLDVEGDGYSLEPFAPDYDFKTRKSVPAKEALHEAETFVSRHSSFLRSELSAIIDENGDIAGYEVRPLYRPLSFGRVDVLDVLYKVKGVTIIVTIRVDPSVERRLHDDGRGGRPRRR